MSMLNGRMLNGVGLRTAGVSVLVLLYVVPLHAFAPLCASSVGSQRSEVGKLTSHCPRWAAHKLETPACGLEARARAYGLSTLAARGSDDEIGDITRLLADEPVVVSGNQRMFPVNARSARVAETDIVMGTGIGQSEQLQDAIDQAVAAAMVNWPINAEGLPTVPSLAMMFFSSQYAQQGLGRVLPCLLRTFATTGGKPWKVGVSVVGCSAAGFDLEDKDTPAVSVTLIQGNLLTVVPFCAGDEAAGWSEADWGYKAGLKGLYDDTTTSMVLLGHPSSEAATERALQHLSNAYPMSNKLGGIAGAAPASELDDRCVIFRKGTGVLNKKGKLLYGADKNAAKYSTSDDLFFDGGTWRRSGLVGLSLSLSVSHVRIVSGACSSSLSIALALSCSRCRSLFIGCVGLCLFLLYSSTCHSASVYLLRVHMCAY